jgi:hypothetical protein
MSAAPKPGITAHNVTTFPTRSLSSTTMSFLRLAVRSSVRPRMAFATASAPRIHSRLPPRANFAAAAGLSKDEIQSRVLDVLKGFEKVDPAKVAPLGLSVACLVNYL